jgi:hypothetical protein
MKGMKALKALAATHGLDLVDLPKETSWERETRRENLSPEEFAEYEAPLLEVGTPEGYVFASGLHALICYDAVDALDRLMYELPLEKCPSDCTC